MALLRFISAFVALQLCLPVATFADDFTQLGGEMTSYFDGRFAIQLPAPNVVDNERRNLMLSGFSIFHKQYSESEGAGPFLVNDSCGGCHVQNGRGPLLFSKSNIDLTSVVLKLSIPGSTEDGSPKAVPGLGSGVLQDHTIGGKVRFSPRIRWRLIKRYYPDKKSYVLRQPIVRFKAPAKSGKKLRYSLRMSPAIIGVGLIEAIDEATILERSDPSDSDNDGISGRVNYVANKRTGLNAVGRFGFKAGQPTVEQQTLSAFFNEMGITNELFNNGESQVELDNNDLNSLLFYQRLAGVPAATLQSNQKVLEGQELFYGIGCESCHRATVTTGNIADPELSQQTIHPFTDLLLHNMGSELADKHTEFGAKGYEWRTAPLWGLGFAKTISSVKPLYLHDGRARSIEEAILWHGGEAKRSREKFKRLSVKDRSRLLKFLASL